ncbi:hypothetical protein AMTRI_Chr06g169290 [Amborella trichopoda]
MHRRIVVSRSVEEVSEEDNALSISDQRTLYLVNIFIVDTARFLNRFSALCEQKLADVHRRILRLDATLTLLEAKLRSIDGIEEIKDGSRVKERCFEYTNGSCSSAERSHEPTYGSIMTLSESHAPQQTPSTSVQPSTPSQNQPPFDDDPRLARFCRMLHFGVPEQAVKMQMSIEGMDPSLLNQFNRRSMIS